PPAATEAGANLNVPPALTDKRVRQAMNHAVDRASIAETLFAGTAEQCLWALPSDAWADPAWFDMYQYDVEQARSLMAEAGYENGFDVNMYTIGGERLPQIRESTEAVMAYLNEIDIRVNLTTLEYSQWLESVF